eukprot:CAMPEP_0172537800 /NCGR_PEP_ID=MMETSP1067-20121228/9337_1 /TAXON_ID=265564 ORGANISM="Thalassiosira punctigera, Strain Tpunct2005C2" /NCGR_SAMPLE_ID=MMETSP1067 /ASSEMBLY_ACC=CAM_ASM_000444 /LENGTH=30 /DNA_ID= /DNA_START= /DNA_END= /DNA_ORIENTATION=
MKFSPAAKATFLSLLLSPSAMAFTVRASSS